MFARMLPTLHETRQFWDSVFLRSVRKGATAGGRDLSGVVEFLRSYGVVSVLDAGCGFGHWSLSLARAGFQLTATDISSEAVRMVENQSRQEGLSITAEVCAMQELEHLGRRFDAIVCNSVLDHMPPHDAALAVRNISQVVEPGGIAYLSFDGLKEMFAEEARQIVVHGDGTWQYMSGDRKGMVWRYYQDEEIRQLCLGMEVLEFDTGAHGQRKVWLKAAELANHEV